MSQQKSSHQYQRHSASSSFVVAMSRRFDAQSIRRNKLFNRDRFETSSFASFFILCGGHLLAIENTSRFNRKYITVTSKSFLPQSVKIDVVLLDDFYTYHTQCNTPTKQRFCVPNNSIL